MAVFPCDWSAHRYPGPQRSIYVTVATGSDAETVKLRLCQRHFGETMDVVSKQMSLVDEDSQMSYSCERCHNDREATYFAKMYDEHAEPMQYAVDLCHGCGRELAALLKVSNGRHMTGR